MESFGYDPLQSTAQECYYHPVDELIYQEHSDRETASFNFPAYGGPPWRQGTSEVK